MRRNGTQILRKVKVHLRLVLYCQYLKMNNLTRTEVIKETVLSFLVSLSSGSYIEELCIIIHPYDMKKYKIDLVELLDFIRLHCINTNYIVNQRNPKGIGLD